MLKYPDPNKAYILTTDASNHTVSSALSQLNDNGEEEVITFISRTLKGAELNYYATEKELLAVAWSCLKLDTYLRGAKEVIVRTDHKALTFLKNCKFTNSRLVRWTLFLQDYNIKYEYLPGEKNHAADFLSRCINEDYQEGNQDLLIASMLRKPARTFVKNIKQIEKL